MSIFKLNGQSKQKAIALRDAIAEYSDTCIEHGFDSRQAAACRSQYADLAQFRELARAVDRTFMRIADSREDGRSR